jgi:dihydrofolate reductase
MRKIIVLSFITLDGVMQAPGGPDEDTSSGFKYGGWTVPYHDESTGKVMLEQLGHPYDLLLGRKTYDIFKAYWPQHNDNPIGQGINKATKYVASTTLAGAAKKFDWEKTVILNDDVVEKIKKLKQENGPELQVHGSGNFIQTLLKNDLVDELWLKIFPITLGTGKRLFADGVIPAAFTLEACSHSPSGVIFANFKRAGEVKTGSF